METDLCKREGLPIEFVVPNKDIEDEDDFEDDTDSEESTN